MTAQCRVHPRDHFVLQAPRHDGTPHRLKLSGPGHRPCWFPLASSWWDWFYFRNQWRPNNKTKLFRFGLACLASVFLVEFLCEGRVFRFSAARCVKVGANKFVLSLLVSHKKPYGNAYCQSRFGLKETRSVSSANYTSIDFVFTKLIPRFFKMLCDAFWLIKPNMLIFFPTKQYGKTKIAHNSAYDWFKVDFHRCAISTCVPGRTCRMLCVIKK